MNIKKVDSPNAMKNAGSKPRYVPPAIVPLGALAVGSGKCQVGSAVEAACGGGNGATTSCGGGNKVGAALRGKN